MNRKKPSIELLKKGCELYLLGLKIEELRQRLNYMQDLKNLSEPEIVETSEILSGYILKFMALEDEFKEERVLVHN